MATGGRTDAEDVNVDNQEGIVIKPSNTRRVEIVRVLSLSDDELGPGMQTVQASLEKGNEGVYINDPEVSNNDTLLESNANSGSNSSFTSAVGTPTTSKHYFLSNRKVTSTSSHVLHNMTSRSAAPAT